MTNLIDGKFWAKKIRLELKQEISRITESGFRAPELAVIQVGDDSASSIYVRNKRLACEKVGIKSSVYKLPAAIGQVALLDLIDALNQNENIDGILCQLPLPSGYDEQEVIDKINPDKDVDGFHPMNKGLLSIGRPKFSPCTPVGILTLLEREGVELEGKLVLIIGRSNIVGKPIAQMLLQKNATVIQAHSHTKNIANLCLQADIVVVAVGSPEFVKASWLKSDAVVIDVGINRQGDGSLIGDVELAGRTVVSKITPVPGGVGPMTVASLLANTVKSYRSHYKISRFYK